MKNDRSIGVLAMFASLFGACDTDDRGSSERTPDAAPAILDAASDPYTCTPRAQPPPACLALAPSTLRGQTPFGDLDVALDYFGAGDCISISLATIGWRGACGEQLHLTFPYPVTTDGARRRVTTSFDADARFELDPPDGARRMDVTMIHVDVVRWEEGQDTHDIDITVTITDPAYQLAPLRVQGTFCDWAYLLC